MTINYCPEPTLLMSRRYIQSPDGDEEILYSGDRAWQMADERLAYLIIDGHAYYQEPEERAPSIWRGRDVYAGRSIA